jgi:hypothetical protein
MRVDASGPAAHRGAARLASANPVRPARRRSESWVALSSVTFLDDPTQTPATVITTVARQLGEVPLPGLDAYRDGRQCWRHKQGDRDPLLWTGE